MTRSFSKIGVDVRTGTAVTAVEEELCASCVPGEGHQRYQTVARLSDGTSLPFGVMVWSAGLAQVKLVERAAELRKGPTGRILVNKFLRAKFDQSVDAADWSYCGGSSSSSSSSSSGADGDGIGETGDGDGVDFEARQWAEASGGRVYALGDCAVNVDAPLAPLAQVAEQQGDYLASCFNNTYHAHLTKGLPDSHPLPLPEAVKPSSFPPLPTFLFDKHRSFRWVNRGSMVSMGQFRGIVDLTHVEPGEDADTSLMSDATLSGAGVSGFTAWLTWNGTYLTKQYSIKNMILNPMYKFKCMLFGRDISRF